MHSPSPSARTWELVRTEQSFLGIAVVYSVAIGLLSLVLPVAIQSLVNSVAFGSVLQPIVILTILVSAALAGSAVLTVLRTVVLESMQCRIFVRQASESLDSLLRYRIGSLDAAHAPELVNRFLDVTTVQKSATVLAVDGLTVVMQTLVSVALLAAYHPYLLVFDVLLIASIAFILSVLGRGAVRTSIEESRAKYDLVAWLEEVARHSASFRSPTAGQLALDRTNELVTTWLGSRAGHFRILLRQVIGTQFLQAAALSLLLGVGGYLVIAGELTLGQLVAAELALSAAVASVAKFSKSLETFYDLQAALDKLEHLTGLATERTGGESSPDQQGPAALHAAGLTFGYDGREPVLANASLTVPAGAKVAIHARGGSGKSTLLDLLFALREPASGRIELDGADYRHLSLDAIREQVMLVRGTETFPGTIFDNVALGAPVSSAEVRAALERAGVLDAVNRLPDGLQTSISASGRPLSPSQAMRLTMARAILHRPRLLLIDEALDSIDDLRTDGQLVSTLFADDAPWTLIVATERPDLWPMCTQLYDMEAGTLSRSAHAR